MKFEIKKEILKDALRDANRFRGARSPLAVLHGYYLNVDDNSLTCANPLRRQP